MQAFAQDLGCQGPPFIWDSQRRFVMRCELDALYFHLYGIKAADIDYIMESFPIVKSKELAEHGEYRSKRLIMELYERMAALPALHAPAPKPEDGEIMLPDVSHWRASLSPPPAHPHQAHDSRERPNQ